MFQDESQTLPISGQEDTSPGGMLLRIVHYSVFSFRSQSKYYQ